MAIWTPEEDDVLRQNVRIFSFTKIASILPGRTRNACIGRAERLGLSGPRIIPKRTVVVKPPKHRAVPKVARAPEKAQLAPDAATDPSVVATLKGWPKPTTPTAVLLWDLTRDHCRMPLFGDGQPLDQQFYCGAPVASETSWCAACSALVYPGRAAA